MKGFESSRRMQEKTCRKQDFISESGEMSELRGTLELMESQVLNRLNLEWQPW